MQQYEGYFHTCKMLLSRFHFVCNGSAPFRLDWNNSSIAEVANLEPKQVQLIKDTQMAITMRGTFLWAIFMVY